MVNRYALAISLVGAFLCPKTTKIYSLTKTKTKRHAQTTPPISSPIHFDNWRLNPYHDPWYNNARTIRILIGYD